MSSSKRPPSSNLHSSENPDKKLRPAEQTNMENGIEKALPKFPSLETFRIVQEASRVDSSDPGGSSEPQIQALRTKVTELERSSLDETENLRKSLEQQIQGIKNSILQITPDFQDEMSKQIGDVRDYIRRTGSNLESMVTTQGDQVNRTFDRKIQTSNNHVTSLENRIIEIESSLASLASLPTKFGNIVEGKMEEHRITFNKRLREIESKLNRELQQLKSTVGSVEANVDKQSQELQYQRLAMARMQSIIKDINAKSPQPLPHIDFMVHKKDPQAES